jgi:hypothetical protein
MPHIIKAARVFDWPNKGLRPLDLFDIRSSKKGGCHEWHFLNL